MSETVHLDRKFLLAFSRGDVPLEILAKMSLEHLAELCPRCRRELKAVQDQLTLSPSVPMVQAVLKSTLGESRMLSPEGPAPLRRGRRRCSRGPFSCTE